MTVRCLSRSRTRLLLAMLHVVAITLPLMADDPLVATPQTNRTTFFSDEQVAYKIDFASDHPADGTVNWKLSTLHRTLGGGELAMGVEVDQTQTVACQLRMPHVKEGVIRKVALGVEFTPADGDAVTIFQRNFWVFPPDPFVDRSEWLEQLDLQLYDPVGETAKLLDRNGIPFREIRSLAALDAIEDGIVMVGEGVSLRKDSDLGQSLFSLAANGRRVLWLGAQQGDFELPGAGEDSEQKRPDKLLFSGSDRLEQLDKRLDPNVWLDDPQSVAMQLIADRGRTSIEFVDSDRGWTWLTAEFAEADGKLIVCGLKLSGHWDVSPTPRYMLARLLEELENTEPTEPPDDRE